MRSCIYECRVVHERFSPRAHRFRYGTFMFCLDLSEIDEIADRFLLISRNRFNLFAFHDRDHTVDAGGSVRDNVIRLLRTSGVGRTPGRVLLVTNLRILGYVFNPVSFFYCFDEAGEPLAVVATVNNTYEETRSYVIHASPNRERVFTSRQKKHFYISPFIQLDSELEMTLSYPVECLRVIIDDFVGEEKVLSAALEGRRTKLSRGNLAWMTVKYPFVTAKVILAIHWEALRLWIKGVPFIHKREQPELQLGVKRASAAKRSAWREE